MELQVINPYDNSLVERLETSTEPKVKECIANAIAAGAEFARMPACQRGEILNRAADLIKQNAEELSQLIVRESGKPMRYASGEVKRCIETFTFAADVARSLHGETIPMDAAKNGVGKQGFYIRVPVGLVAAITPFNFPLNLVAHKVAPALACGCSIVLKPAPATPLTALKLAELLKEAGLPEHVFGIVLGEADVGKWLTRDERVNMISFTGSAPVAKAHQSRGRTASHHVRIGWQCCCGDRRECYHKRCTDQSLGGGGICLQRSGVHQRAAPLYSQERL